MAIVHIDAHHRIQYVPHGGRGKEVRLAHAPVPVEIHELAAAEVVPAMMRRPLFGERAPDTLVSHGGHLFQRLRTFQQRPVTLRDLLPGAAPPWVTGNDTLDLVRSWHPGWLAKMEHGTPDRDHVLAHARKVVFDGFEEAVRRARAATEWLVAVDGEVYVRAREPLWVVKHIGAYQPGDVARVVVALEHQTAQTLSWRGHQVFRATRLDAAMEHARALAEWKGGAVEVAQDPEDAILRPDLLRADDAGLSAAQALIGLAQHQDVGGLQHLDDEVVLAFLDVRRAARRIPHDDPMPTSPAWEAHDLASRLLEALDEQPLEVTEAGGGTRDVSPTVALLRMRCTEFVLRMRTCEPAAEPEEDLEALSGLRPSGP